MNIERWNAIAEDYSAQILSPFAPEVENPLLPFLGGLKEKGYKDAADIGCGTGSLLGTLAMIFPNVYGLDFSSKMLQIAKDTVKCGNVSLLQEDILHMSEAYRESFDLCTSVNSIIPPRYEDAPLIITEIFRCLRPNGIFAGILPAIEAVIHQKRLAMESLRREGSTEKEAREISDRYFYKKNKLDLEMGMYADDGTNLHKHFYLYEIFNFFAEAGFQNISHGKVEYPWTLTKLHGYGYYPDKPKIWDWFITAEKL